MRFLALCAECGREVRASEQRVDFYSASFQVSVYYIRCGSATPMRGKSLTCREASLSLTVYDRRELCQTGSETQEKEGLAAGKSATCRASAWQSPCATLWRRCSYSRPARTSPDPLSHRLV